MLGKLNAEQMDHVLRSQVVGRIGCYADDTVYVVPITYLYDGQHIYGHTREGHILAGINQFTRLHQANLLVIGYHPHSGWESFILGKHTQKMASHPNLPLLILPY
jgi:hypothetical protein